MRDVMNYHCLRVFTSRVKRIEKHSPGFSMFRTREHGCSDAELCRVPIQSTVGAIFLLGNRRLSFISLSHSDNKSESATKFYNSHKADVGGTC